VRRLALSSLVNRERQIRRHVGLRVGGVRVGGGRARLVRRDLLALWVGSSAGRRVGAVAHATPLGRTTRPRPRTLAAKVGSAAAEQSLLSAGANGRFEAQVSRWPAVRAAPATATYLVTQASGF